MREDEDGAITDANNITTDICSRKSSSQRENLNAIFTSENLEKPDDLVNAVKNMTINEIGYEVNKSTVSDAQVDLVINPDKFTRTSNIILDQKLLSYRIIREVSILPPQGNLRIPTIEILPHMLLTTTVQ